MSRGHLLTIRNCPMAVIRWSILSRIPTWHISLVAACRSRGEFRVRAAARSRNPGLSVLDGAGYQCSVEGCIWSFDTRMISLALRLGSPPLSVRGSASMRFLMPPMDRICQVKPSSMVLRWRSLSMQEPRPSEGCRRGVRSGKTGCNPDGIPWPPRLRDCAR